MHDLHHPNDGTSTSPEDYLRHHLIEIVELLNKQKLEETIVQQQSMPNQDLVETLMSKRHQMAIKDKLDDLHAADIAYILEALPVDQRLIVWSLVSSDLDGLLLRVVHEDLRSRYVGHAHGDAERGLAPLDLHRLVQRLHGNRDLHALHDPGAQRHGDLHRRERLQGVTQSGDYLPDAIKSNPQSEGMRRYVEKDQKGRWF